MVPWEDWLIALGRASLMLVVSAIPVQAAILCLRVSSPRAQRVCWGCVLLQGLIFFRVPLLIPWFEPADPPARVSVGQLARQEHREPLAPRLTAPAPAIDGLQDPTAVAADAVPADTPSSLPLSPQSPVWTWPQVVGSIWALGTVLVATSWLAAYVRFVRRLSWKTACRAWHEEWQELVVDLGVSKSVKLGVTADLGPALCLLPSGYHVFIPESLWQQLDGHQRRAILLHELTHYQRGDLWKSLALRLIVILHWFNLGAWWSIRRFEASAEWLCDDRVKEKFGAVPYSRALMLIGRAGGCTIAHGQSGSGGQVFQRVNRILAPVVDSVAKQSALLAVASALLFFGLFQVRLIAQQDDAAPPAGLTAASATGASKSTPAITPRLPAGARQQLGTTRLRQPTSVFQMRYSPDGKTLAVCGDGSYDPWSSVCLWDTSTGELRLELRVPVTTIAYSPGGEVLAAGDVQGRIHLWQASTGRAIRVMQSELLVAGDLSDLRIYDLAFQDERTLLSAHRRQIRQWDIEHGVEATHDGRRNGAAGFSPPVLAVSPDGRLLASTTRGGILVWNTQDNGPPQTIELPGIFQLKAVAFTNRSSLATCGWGWSSMDRARPAANIRFFDLDRGVPSATALPDDEVTRSADDIAVDWGRQQLVTAGGKGLHVWDLTEQTMLRQIPRVQPRGSTPTSVAVSPQGDQVAVAGRGSKIDLFELATGELLCQDPPSHSDQVVSVACSAVGGLVLTGGRDNMVHLWDGAAGVHLRELSFFPGDAHQIQAVAISPDSQLLAVLGNFYQTTSVDPVGGSTAVTWVR